MRDEDRPHEKLSPEKWNHVCSEVRKIIEEGCLGPSLEPSLLGLDWSAYTTRKFPEHADSVAFWNPPEFIEFGFSGLDAYATAILSAIHDQPSLNELIFTCSLLQREESKALYLEFKTTPLPLWAPQRTVMIRLLTLFPATLQARGIDNGPVFFNEFEGCVMQISYPGRMVASKSPFLRDRTVDLWPKAELKIKPEINILQRAQAITKALLDPSQYKSPPV